MKTLFSFILIIAAALQHVGAQVVKDPLLAYYQALGNPAQFPPETRVYYFEAAFTGGGKNTVFITSHLAKLGPHGTYAWSVYCPTNSGDYSVVSDSTHFLVAGLKGPDYIGYIDKIKKYGAITAAEGGKYGVTAQYLDDGVIKSQPIDDARGHADANHYPAYFKDKIPDYGITTYTLNQLQTKYASPATTNAVTPGTK